MLVCQVIISFYDLMKVRLHKLKNNINVFKITSRRWHDDPLDFNNIRMAQKTKELDFAQNPDSIRHMLKNVSYFLYRYFSPSVCVNCSTNNTVATLSNNFQNFVSIGISVVSKKFCLLRNLQINPCIVIEMNSICTIKEYRCSYCLEFQHAYYLLTPSFHYSRKPNSKADLK